MGEEAVDDTDVVIIGAGASGLAAIKQLTTTTELKVVCFEARSGPGGVWNPTNDKKGSKLKIGFDGVGRPVVEPPPMDASPIYAGLRTNVPKKLMAYHRRPFVTDDPASDFPPAHEVSSYLLEAARGLDSVIQFNSQVLRVAHLPPHTDGGVLPHRKGRRRWLVDVVSHSSAEPAHHQQTTRRVSCDFVLVASGHYSVPYIPFIPSLWTWPKEIVHSCVYMCPSDTIFHEKTVAVIGIGPSGYDIVRELAMLREQEAVTRGIVSTKKLYSVASHPATMGWDFNDPAAPSWAKLITTVPRFESVQGGLIRLVDGRTLEDVEVLCFATGYLYAFPFCHPADEPWSAHPLTRPPPTPPTSSSPPNLPSPAAGAASLDDFLGGFRVHHLDQTQMFYYPDPSLAFLVLNSQVIPFPLAEYQARAIAARWSGRKPFALERMEDEETESKGVHALPTPKDFEYEDRLLARIGEGGALDTDTHWGSVPEWKYKAREQTPAKRRLELGY
ncbi:hypothetical protein PCANC_19931 [Puccinia coronata f. sp. avenae]|uniref:FAD/NAD(P)-binding domain-containing protein n=1 Tax=Puccinia coronata f. sp. avenae TaxID=200324 RepID=A0A2N5SAE4_9BASI|nr:hypothetical protein PCANC_19931 [Puccinia coronata f. sp. avenae]